MKRAWVDLLCDPKDGTKLKLVEPVIKNGRILSGKLIGNSGNVYIIKEGIPIMLTPDAQSLDSVESFAFEWNEWGYLFAKKNWLKNNILPILKTEKVFKNKIIVDAGAGSGAPSRWMAEAGAKLVISLELSAAIFIRHKETIKGFEDVIFPIQCDISHLPISIKPDILYCINVLQHTKDPKRTFANLVTLLDRKSLFIFNVYNKEGLLGSKTVSIFRQLIKWLPLKAWRWLSFLVAGGVFIIHKLMPWMIKKIYKNIHFSSDFKELWLQIYDAFGSHYYQFPLTQKEQFELFKNAGLKVKVKNDFGYLLEKNRG